MAQPYVGEIRMFAGNFAPAGWAFCDGQLMPISENETLFQLIGTTYGGDGESTFAMPDLRGRIPIHFGSGGGTTYILAESGGVESITLTTNQMAAHTHPALGSSGIASNATPTGLTFATASGGDVYNNTPPGGAPLLSTTISYIGGSQPHNNIQPFLCVNFIISLFGIFPSPT